MKTRIKVCGITTAEDLDACVTAGIDAVGFVFYPASPRYVTPRHAAMLVRRLPPFVTAVGLFVNAPPDALAGVLAEVPLGLLQFHGEEDERACRAGERPYVKAARVRAGLDLLQFAAAYPSAQGILCDAYVDGFGGSGQMFDWALIPTPFPRPLILSGGLSPDNVGTAIRRLRPAAVDVSSGVERAKGVKDHAKIAAFVSRVRETDESI